VAHDKFQEIVDEANNPASPIHFGLKKIELDNGTNTQKIKAVTIPPKIEHVIYDKPWTPAQKRVVDITMKAIERHEDLPSSSYLIKPDFITDFAADIEAEYKAETAEELDFGTNENNGKTIADVVKEVVKTYVDTTIDIPRIVVYPKDTKTIAYEDFMLDCSSIHYQPVSHELFIHYLRTNEQKTLSLNQKAAAEMSLEDYLIRSLIDFDDVSYDDQADQLYSLCSQMIKYLSSYLKDNDSVENVVRYYEKPLADFIHSQMLAHQSNLSADFEVKVSKGFTQIKKQNFTVQEGNKSLSFRDSSHDNSTIKQFIFDGFKKCIYDTLKFDSGSERRFARLLEDDKDCLKWLKPVDGQFQIWYQIEGEPSEYVPDFAVVTVKDNFMIETKRRDQLDSSEVLAKKAAAIEWCKNASDFALKNKCKPWFYVLIPHDEIKDNMTLAYLSSAYCC
jgi:type III restriction enzyme